MKTLKFQNCFNPKLRMWRPDLRIISLFVSARGRWICSSSVRCNKQEGNIEESKKSSFVKDLFLGKFDAGILQYPFDQKSMKLECLLPHVERYFLSEVKSKDIHIVRDDLAQFGLFGLRIPPEYGGLGLTASEYVRVKELIALDCSVSDVLYGHEALCAQPIVLYGSESQKRKYLPKLTKGETIAALCLSEGDFGADLQAVTTQAVLSSDGTTWTLNGRKKWVMNGPIADVFIVLALTGNHSYSIFIVEKGFNGIKIGEPLKKLGKLGCGVCEVEFRDTTVPADNILGRPGQGFPIALQIFSGDDFSIGSTSASMLRKLTNSVAEYSGNRHTLENFGVQISLTEVLCSIYAMESMSYITSGILDNNCNQDCRLESSIIKVFSTEILSRYVSKFQTVFRSNVFVDGSPFERYFRDCKTIISPSQGIVSLRTFIALAGLQHVGISHHETIKKLRNPLMYPGFFVKNILEDRNDANDKPKLLLGLKNLVHSSLKVPAEQLEYSINRLRYASNFLLTRDGNEVVQEDLDMCRLADVAINIFAMTAVIARASQSCSSGMLMSDLEIILVRDFCSHAIKEIKMKIEDILGGPLETNDMDYLKIGRKCSKSKGYFAQHPLTRNF